MKLPLILTAACATACATACTMVIAVPAYAQDANIEGRVVKLEKEVRAVQRKVFPESAGKFFEPEIKPETAVTPTSNSSSNSAVSDLIARVDALESQLATMTGNVERQGNSMRALDSRLKAVETQLKGPDSSVTSSVAPSSAPSSTLVALPAASKPAATAAAKPKPSSARAAAVGAIEKPASGDAFDDSYTYGYRLWEAKFYPEAQAQLQETVTKYPKNSRISYARNLLGRTWLEDKKPATAVKIFYDNYKLDPRGDRASDSLYFLGSALTDLGKLSDACEAFGQLASAYPDVAGGRLASRLSTGRARAKCK
jgi:TolA-binding protein